MGSRLFGVLSEIYINNFQNLLFSPQNKINTHHIKQWHRYCDDILILWYGYEVILLGLHNLMQSHSNLTFTIELVSNNSINFLDPTINRNYISKSLNYNIIKNLTTTDNIIPYISIHVPSTKNLALIFNFNGLLNIPLNSFDFNIEYTTILQIIKNNNYPLDYVGKIYRNYYKSHYNTLFILTIS